MCREAWSLSIPVIIGGVSEEGLFSYREAIDYPDTVNQLRCENLVPLDLNLDPKDAKSLTIANNIKKFYFGEKEPSMETLNEYIMVYELNGKYRIISSNNIV